MSKKFSPTDNTYTGLVYRRKLPYIVTICDKNESTDNCGTERQETQYLLPHSNSIMVMPIKAGYFVTTKHTLAFENGEPTQVKIEQGSEGLALASFPFTLAKTILGVPAEILQLKIDYKSKEAKLTEAQKNVDQRTAGIAQGKKR